MIELYNCDCKELIDSDKLDGKKIVIVTDPPFNIGYKYNTYKDHLKEHDYLKLMEYVLTNNQFPFVVIHYPEELYKISHFINVIPTKVVSWVYNSNTARQHRDIAYFKIKPDFRKVTQPYKNLNDKRIKERIARGITGGRLYDWWNINQVKNVQKKEMNHPCVMPIEVMKNVIGILPEDYIVFDPFMGSGTTGIACKELGRSFIGCEIDKEYFEIAEKRINNELNLTR